MEHKRWNPGTLMAQAYRDIANEHNATVDALEAALAAVPCAVPERASDEELGEVLRRELGMEGLPRPVRAAAAVRARVEAPLLAEIQRLDIENRDRAFYVEQFAAVSQDRDTLKARVAELEAGKAGWCERDRGNLLLEMSGLREQLTALRQLDTVPAGVPSVEDLVRTYCEAAEFNPRGGVDSLKKQQRVGVAAIRDAVLRGMGAAGVDPDAWKTPLVLESKIDGLQELILVTGGIFHDKMAQIQVKEHPSEFSHKCFNLSVSDAARVAAHLASYAVAHGCPVGFGEDRESLVNALIEAKRQRDELACKLIAKNPSEPVYGGWHFEDGYKIAPNGEPSKNTGELPAEPVSDTYKLPTPSGAQVEALPETPKGLPDIDHLEAIFDNTYGATKSDKKALEAVVTELRPWLREPTGWELDVTPNEAMRAYCETYHEGAQKDWQAVLDLCRSRIRPTFECAECAGWKAKYLEASKHADDMHARNKAARAALEGE